MTIVIDEIGVELTCENGQVYRATSLEDARQYADDVDKFDRMSTELKAQAWAEGDVVQPPSSAIFLYVKER